MATTIYGTKLPYQPTKADIPGTNSCHYWTPDKVRDFLDSVRSGNYTKTYSGPSGFVQAIDPDTGDSVLQIAARLSSPFDTINNIMGSFPPGPCLLSRPYPPFYEWARHALLVHQNYNGDTILHIAARSGNQLLLTMLLRCVANHWSLQCPEIIEMDDGPPEHENWDDEFSPPILLILITKNNMGREPAAEARLTRHDDLAEWLDAIKARLDPDGTRCTDEHVAEMIEYVRLRKRHEWITERDVENINGYGYP